jgi:hypothetical protein
MRVDMVWELWPAIKPLAAPIMFVLAELVLVMRAVM